jgi:hypothetical protein
MHSGTLPSLAISHKSYDFLSVFSLNNKINAFISQEYVTVADFGDPV